MTTKKQQNDKDAAPEGDLNFEKALERLETIVKDMEDGSLGLEQMMQRFEEGQKLVAVCSRKLNEVERKIEVLAKKGDDLKLQPFDTEPAEPEADASDELF
ncbi:MAG: exodeoxyribonuclease VII small subunit [Lentisphaerales bacterium]|jgi:exodeoxyribonuclease VII small subunit|nr:MAG: exodeoxyribonuclease VII small subunit [Lentisphaerales bacterium]